MRKLGLSLVGFALALGCAGAPPGTSAPAHPGYVVDGLDATTFLPLPEKERMPAFTEKGYLLDDLGGGAYGVRNARGSDSMFLVTETGVVVVDAPWAGDEVKAAIAEVTHLPVTHFIYSHSHSDHTGGAATFLTANVGGTSPIYIAHELAAERIRRAADPRRPAPTQTVSGDHYVLETGGNQIILDYHGNLHSPGDLFVYAPKQKVLMVVDVIAPGYGTYFHLAHTLDVPLYMTVADTVLTYDFDTYVGGHAYRYGTRADIETYGRYLHDLDQTARQVFTEGQIDFSKLEPGNAWGASQLFYGTMARQTAERMPKHWLTELAAADIFVEGSARALLFSLAVEYAPFTPVNNPDR
jgi:glyoxylase-like metal-dependent hydrolase (beta-lactamase superfamily II)